MKKLSLISALVMAVALITVSCKKDDETPSYKQEDFIGEWDVTAYDAVDESDEGPCEYEITETEISETSGCDGFSVSIFGEYDFDGKNKITLDDDGGFGFTIHWIIADLDDETMKLVRYVEGEKLGTVTLSKR